MYILGISAYYHDSAAVIMKDGRVLFAAEEERFSRIKHDNSFPHQSVAFCLRAAGLKITDIDAISYYEKPLLKLERILETFIDTYPRSFMPFQKGIPEVLGNKIKIEQTIRKKLGFHKQIYFIPHHLSHAAAGFYPSSFEKAAVLTIDGVGEYQTTGIWSGGKNTLTSLQSINFPHSLGLLYSTFTAFLGFRVNDDEYKVMGLAAYGKPHYVDKIYQTISVKDDGSFRLDMKYFAFRESFQMWSKEFEKLFGVPRKNSDAFEKRHKDLAASIQKVTEEIYFKILRHAHTQTKSDNLCVSGGVALNALANGKIYENTPFKNIFVFGAAGDSGGAIGAALFTYYSILKNKKRVKVEGLDFGSKYADSEIEKALREKKLSHTKFSSEKLLVKTVAKLLAENQVVGWFQGRMEFGPRALGNRSILANPRDRFMKEKVNRIKVRELFRPFAGSVLQEHVQDLFMVPKNNLSAPFMNFCFQVKKEKRKDIAAIVHEDSSCRIQTVSQTDGIYYNLIKEFYRVTGIPCILNTSFNLKGEPIVENPEQAIDDFIKTKMDYLVIENFLIQKK